MNAAPANLAANLTYDDYAEYPNDGYRHEIIDGEHFVNVSPNPYHETVSRRVKFQLYEQIERQDREQVFSAPCNVELSLHNILQPDIVVVLTANTQIVKASHIQGIPDLVVEIISPSTRSNDVALKREIYEHYGVPEYWIIDPYDSTVRQLILCGTTFRQQDHDDHVALTVIDDVSVDFEKVW